MSQVGDRLMVAMQLAPGASFDPGVFKRFIEAQPDLGPKWVPSFVRIVTAFPMTETNKVVKRLLQAERWESDDPTWWRPAEDGPYIGLDSVGVNELRRRFDDRGRSAVLEAI